MTDVRVDIEAITELKELLGSDFNLLIETYINDTRAKLDLLKMSLVKEEFDEIIEASHSVKGASLNMGILRLSELCQKVETAAREGDLSVGLSLMTQMLEEADFAFSTLNDFLAA